MIMKSLNQGSPGQIKGVSAVSNRNVDIRISVHFSFSVVQNVRIGGFISRDKTAMFVHKTIVNDGSWFA